MENAFHKISQDDDIEYLFLLGDLTGYGDTQSLSKIKEMLDSTGMTYYAIPGDHDLTESLGFTNFTQVFENNMHKIKVEDITFLMLDNSANFTEILSSDMTWFKNNVGSADFVFLSQPLYTEELNSPFSSLYMGSTLEKPEDEDMLERQSRVLAQRDELLKEIRESEIKAVVAGDHHKSSDQEDPEDADLSHHVVGAISGTVNELPQTLLQSPRFSVMTVFDDSTYELEEVLLD